MVDDAILLERCLSGDVQAFERLIERYQSLICAITFSGTGNQAQSEDLAQETFIAAWRNISSVRDRGKFRQWICGIARNLTRNHHRRAYRTPHENLPDSAPIEETPIVVSTPREQAIGREEEEIVWRELQKIPELYREPMILYYRMNQSIQTTAEALDLSEDAVKQRLARGRKLLHDRMSVFVEERLERIRVTPNFSAVVLSAISMSTPTIKTGGLASAATATGWFGKIASFLFSLPVLSWLAGAAIGFYFNIQWQLKTIQSKKEKRLIILALLLLFSIFFISHIFSQTIFSLAFHWPLESLLLLIISFSIFLLLLVYSWGLWFRTSRKNLREREGLPPLVNPTIRDDGEPVYPRIIMALGFLMTNAGALLIPFLPFALLACDTTGQILAGSLYLLIAFPGVLEIYRKPDRYSILLSASTAIHSALALLLIDLRWNVWVAAPGMNGYLTPLSWRLINGFLFVFVILSLWDWVYGRKAGRDASRIRESSHQHSDE